MLLTVKSLILSFYFDLVYLLDTNIWRRLIPSKDRPGIFTTPMKTENTATRLQC